MDRTGDVVDLLVEHATDFRMCDLLDDNVPPGSGGNQSGPRKSGGDATGLGLVPGKLLIIESFFFVKKKSISTSITFYKALESY